MTLTPEQEKDLREAAHVAQTRGMRVYAVTTSDESLPWALFLVPTLDLCDGYVSRARVSPVSAAVDLFQRTLVGYPQGVEPMSLIQERPFVALRAMQVLLASLGLTVGAEKKSLNLS